jgi:hypothetical protein
LNSFGLKTGDLTPRMELKYKEERYSKLLYFLQLAYYRDWKDENHQKFIEEYMKCLLYSSNDVVKHLNDFMNWQSENKT